MPRLLKLRLHTYDRRSCYMKGCGRHIQYNNKGNMLPVKQNKWGILKHNRKKKKKNDIRDKFKWDWNNLDKQRNQKENVSL